MLLHRIDEVREKVREWKKQGLTVGLVPTMGALHKGHLSLIKKSVEKCDKTVISVFVNPIQFCPGEDFEKYPRTLDADTKLAEDAGVDIVFAPSAEEMYGKDHIMSNDFLTYVIPPFFYVNKLFNIVQPDFAFFGEKDRQQLIIIKKMVKDLNIPIEIIPCPIVREDDGLAMSSRNKYLNPEQRKEALVLKNILFNIKSCYNSGIKDVKALTETAYTFLKPCHELEYLEFRDKNDLEQKDTADKNTIVFIAVKIGTVRLIDNISLEAG